tara:strand:- start:655 stop:780 length:126 start_codon:yes stop_codon:yes gene_type:complete
MLRVDEAKIEGAVPAPRAPLYLVGVRRRRRLRLRLRVMARG